MEYWNNGRWIPFKKPYIPAFHHSRFPRRLRSTNPLGMKLIYIYKIVFGKDWEHLYLTGQSIIRDCQQDLFGC